MHSRVLKVEGKQVTLDFGHEGRLYRQSFIMYDKRTNSHWNHSTGLAMAGPLTGTELNTLPSRMVRWGQWKKNHPNTKVLPGDGRAGFMGSYVGGDHPKSIGLSVGRGPRSVLYPFELLLEEKVVNDRVTRRPVVVTIDTEQNQAFVYRRIVNDRVLNFKPLDTSANNKQLMKDKETGSVWNRLTGEAIKGPLKGKQLESEVGVTWMISRWKQIYQNGTIYQE